MHPELFRLGPVPVSGYGTMVLVGVLTGMWLLGHGARRRGWSTAAAWDVAMAIVFGGIAGGRLFYVIQHWEEHFATRPLWSVIAIWEGGLVLYGALFGGAVLLFWMVRRRGWRGLDFLDAAAPGVAAGIAWGRVGCLLNGCCWGKACTPDYWFGIQFPPGSMAGLLAPVHPTQLYESIGAALLSLALWRFDRLGAPVGATSGLLALGYGSLRFVIEGFRGDHEVPPGTWPISQRISVVVVLLGVTLIARAWLRARQARRGGEGPRLG